jgi:hypothetical protein
MIHSFFMLKFTTKTTDILTKFQNLRVLLISINISILYIYLITVSC